jgi:hypothetical protein
MSQLSDLIAQRDALNAQIALYATFPEDIYNLGTLALMVSNSNTVHVYFRKIAEESWKKLSGSDGPKRLADWLYDRRTTDPGTDFEIYIMAPGNTPIYATA